MESISNPENIKEGDTVYFKGDEKRTLPLTVTKVDMDQVTCVCQVKVQALTKEIHSLQVSNPENIQVDDIVFELKGDKQPMYVTKIEGNQVTCEKNGKEKVYPIQRLTKEDPNDFPSGIMMYDVG